MGSVQVYLLNCQNSIYTGSKDEASQRVERYVKSSAEDDIYKTTRGAVKPSKHMLLGMGLKSITSSKKVQEIVNHFGHCIGYHTAEEYETQIAAKIVERRKVLPDGLEARRGLSTISAWDNYDKSMYHDTQGNASKMNPPQQQSCQKQYLLSCQQLLPQKREALKYQIMNLNL